MLPPGAIFMLKIHKNAFAAGASPGPHCGEITELPDSLQGAASQQGRGKEGGEGREGGNRKGIAFPHFFFLQFYHCSAVYSCCDLYTVARLIALQLVCNSVCRHYAD